MKVSVTRGQLVSLASQLGESGNALKSMVKSCEYNADDNNYNIIFGNYIVKIACTNELKKLSNRYSINIHSENGEDIIIRDYIVRILSDWSLEKD